MGTLLSSLDISAKGFHKQVIIEYYVNSLKYSDHTVFDDKTVLMLNVH